MPRLAAAVAAAAALALCPAASGARADAHLSLVAYSTPAGAFAKIIPAFQATSAGRGVSFDQSYGPAETQVRAVVAGLPADVVDFALEPNVTDLVRAGLVAKTWNRNAHDGFVTRSVVVFVVRDGNPKHVRTWNDLVKPGVQVVTPNPFSSGGARWNVMAAYGAMLREQKTPKQAVAYLQELFAHHVVSQDSSARNALQTFLAGKGDVLLTYENEAILAQQQGQPVFYLAPKATIQIENPVAVLATTKSPAAAKAFVNYLWTPAAQTVFAQNGYRPVVPSVYREFAAKFPMPKQLFKIAFVGGWPTVTKRFFNPKTGIMARIEQGLGVATGR
ncbi:MAG TPA: sulfate ABC transporter substrate-binding protein [Gaiellaceae bacterium]|nr:sulfate ABC transporter substrate-binding protein [Gaiellaceae bacterium]